MRISDLTAAKRGNEQTVGRQLRLLRADNGDPSDSEPETTSNRPSTSSTVPSTSGNARRTQSSDSSTDIDVPAISVGRTPSPTPSGGSARIPSDESSVASPFMGGARSWSYRNGAGSYPRTYHLNVIQNPVKAAEFGQNDMSRIPLAPPLFVQLVVRDSGGEIVSAYVPPKPYARANVHFRDDELPFLVAALTLHDLSNLDINDLSHNSELYGTTTSTCHNLRDLHGNRGVFYIFPDVGVRRRGRWRLHISLMRIALIGSPTVLRDGDTGTILAGIWSEPFDVVSADGYCAPPITPLTRHFQSQGVRMFISNTTVPR